MSTVDDDDWPPLTDEDRRGIARIREQLDQEFAAYVKAGAPQPRRHRRALAVLAIAIVTATAAVVGTPHPSAPPAVTERGAVTEPGAVTERGPVMERGDEVAATPEVPPAPGTVRRSPSPRARIGTPRPKAINPAPREAVQTALAEWLDATRRGDVAAQMAFYPAVVAVFYTWRDAPSSSVRAEKDKVLGEAWTLDIQTGPVAIDLAPDGQAAVTRFRKAYVIAGPRVRRRGEVLQELRWHHSAGGWKITSERDAAVFARH